MIEASQLRRGMVINMDGDLYRCTDQQLIKMGRGGATVKATLRNMSSGATTVVSWGSDERLNDIRLESRKVQYLYNDGELYHFMDLETFDQPVLPLAAVED